MRFLPLVALVVSASAEAVFEDSPALTAIWQATSDGSTDAFIAQVIQNEDVGNHRSSDGRGPVFWSYEFKNVDTLALLMHLGVDLNQEDIEGKAAKTFFPESEATRAGACHPSSSHDDMIATSAPACPSPWLCADGVPVPARRV